MTAPAQERLDATKTLHPRTVNRAVSCNAIEHHALELLFGDLRTDALCERLTAPFLANPTTDRPQRNPPSKKSSSRALPDFHKRRKKHCY